MSDTLDKTNILILSDQFIIIISSFPVENFQNGIFHSAVALLDIRPIEHPDIIKTIHPDIRYFQYPINKKSVNIATRYILFPDI